MNLQELAEKMNLQQDWLMVEKPEEPTETTTEAGLILTGGKKDNNIIEAKVLAVGKGHELTNGTVVPLDVKIGDTVVYHKFSDKTYTVQGQEVTFVKESEIFGIIEQT